MAECSIAVFDLGGVLIDWNPRYLYRKLFDGDTEAMEGFLATVCTQAGPISGTVDILTKLNSRRVPL
jgi:hypothetical protein